MLLLGERGDNIKRLTLTQSNISSFGPLSPVLLFLKILKFL